MTCRSWNRANESVWMKDAEAVWPGSPVFAVETMAAVINCAQTAPASAHSKQKRKKHSGFLLFGGDPQAHLQCWPWANRREPRQRGVHLLFVCVFCVRNSVKKKKKTFWGRVERYFQWLPVASIRKGVIFVTIPPQNKVYLSVKRQRFTGIQMTN